VLTFAVSAPSAKYQTGASLRMLYGALLDSLRATPGVHDAAVTSDLPFADGQRHDVYVRVGKGDRSPNLPSAAIAIGSASYPTTMRIAVLRGRPLRDTDDERAPKVVLVNEAFARQAFPNEDAVGRQIDWVGGDGSGVPWTIVGVTRSVAEWTVWDAPDPQIFFPFAQAPTADEYVTVRSDLPPAAVLAAARRAVARVDPTLALLDPRPMAERLDASLAPQRFRAALIGGFGAIALALSLVGVYGVVTHAVSRRTREIGIRMALGQDGTRVRRDVVAGALRIALAGTATGAALALGVGHWLASFLVEVNPRDPVLLGLVGGLLLGATALAAYAPARRASGVDPAMTLHGD
jgi:putative ABC transport system permease protein